MDHFSRRRWRFKINAPDGPGFREKGWMEYKARVERSDGWVERNGTMVNARTSDGRGFSVGPQYAFFDGEERLVAILTPEKVGMIMA